MPIRLTLLTLAIISGVLWISGTAVGIADHQLNGWADTIDTLFKLTLPIGLVVAADRLDRHSQRETDLSVNDASPDRVPFLMLKGAIGLWAAALLITGGAALCSKEPLSARLGQMGDAFNILTCLFLALGFWATIREIHSEQQATEENRSRHNESIRVQKEASKIERFKIQISAVERKLEKATYLLHTCENARTAFMEIQANKDHPTAPISAIDRLLLITHIVDIDEARPDQARKEGRLSSKEVKNAAKIIDRFVTIYAGWRTISAITDTDALWLKDSGPIYKGIKLLQDLALREVAEATFLQTSLMQKFMEKQKID